MTTPDSSAYSPEPDSAHTLSDHPAGAGAPTATMPAPHQSAPPARSTKGLALSALLVGIGALIFSWVPVFGALVGITAIVLAVLALTKKQPKGLAVTGLVLGVIALAISFGGGSDDDSGTTASAPVAAVESASPEAEAEAAPAEAEEAVAEEPPAAAAPAEPAAPAVPVEYASALVKAESYSTLMHMSKAGVYDQLTSEFGEQFTPEAAQYAIDNVVADWNANATEKAKSYQETMSMSPAAIRDQLVSEYGEKFTAEEADYAMLHLND